MPEGGCGDGNARPGGLPEELSEADRRVWLPVSVIAASRPCLPRAFRPCCPDSATAGPATRFGLAAAPHIVASDHLLAATQTHLIARPHICVLTALTHVCSRSPAFKRWFDEF